jgi:predicted AAA+ superfamily ATPase
MYDRIANLSKKHSFFLFGMRGSGKSTLLKQRFPESNIFWIDLLLAEQELKYRSHPDILKDEITALIKEGQKPQRVIIDEVQKIPRLLDVVHYLIENEKIKFTLTGSSARKLKRGGANLLAGRAFVYQLFPLSYRELKNYFNLDQFLSWGGLPVLYGSEYRNIADKNRFLKSYIHTYLKEEILIEQIVRNIDPFHSFLEVAAQMNGEILNFSKIAREANTNDKSIERYYSILDDTLLGFHLMPFHHSVRKQQISSSKFYFFDTGIVRALKNQAHETVNPSTYEYGKLFESFVICEIFKLNKYFEKDYKLSFIKTKDGVEIDLIIEISSHKKYCIEIKSGKVKNLGDFNSQYNLSKDIPHSEFIVLAQNEKPLSDGKIHVLPWRQGIQKIFD